MFEELTVDNFIRCLNDYLSLVKIVDKGVTENLLLYIERAFALGGQDLLDAAIQCIRVDLIYRYY